MSDIQTIFQDYLDIHIDEAVIDFGPLLQQNPEHIEFLTRKISAYKRANALLKDDTKPDVETPQLIGHEIGGCKLIRVLGQGGMGVAYLGRQEKLNRDVVVKVLRPFAVDNKALKERFLRESRTIGRLNHKNIVPVYDVGEQDESFYIIMRHIEGMPLNVFIEKFSKTDRSPSAIRDILGLEAKSTTEFLCNIIIHVADAVLYAHDNGVIHRDIKPSNIILEPNGNPVLLDFGLSHDDVESNLTMTGDFLGTPIYSAPELFQKNVPKDGPQLDVYALGVTLYELLTGGLPYGGDSVYEIYNSIKNKEPINPKSLWNKIPRDLETIVNTSIFKEPRLRYQSINVLKADLQNFLNCVPIMAKSPTLIRKSLFYIVRRKKMFAISAIIVTMFVIAGGSWLLKRVSEMKLLATKATKEFESGSFDGAIEQLEALTKAFPSISDYWMLLGNAQATTGNYKAAIQSFKRVRNFETNEGVLNALVGPYLYLGDVNSAEDCLVLLKGIGQNTLSALTPEYLIGIVKQDIQRSIEVAKKAIEIDLKSEDSVEWHQTFMWPTFGSLAALYKWMGYENIGKEYLSRAISAQPYRTNLYKFFEYFSLSKSQRKYLTSLKRNFASEKLVLQGHRIQVKIPFGWVRLINRKIYGSDVLAAYNAVPANFGDVDMYRFGGGVYVALLGTVDDPVDSALSFLQRTAIRFNGGIKKRAVNCPKNGTEYCVISVAGSFPFGSVKIESRVVTVDSKTYIVSTYAPEKTFSNYADDIEFILDNVGIREVGDDKFQPPYRSYQVWMPETPMYSQQNLYFMDPKRSVRHILISGDITSTGLFSAAHIMSSTDLSDGQYKNFTNKYVNMLTDYDVQSREEYELLGVKHLHFMGVMKGNSGLKLVPYYFGWIKYFSKSSEQFVEMDFFKIGRDLFMLDASQKVDSYNPLLAKKFFSSFEYLGPPISLARNVMFNGVQTLQPDSRFSGTSRADQLNRLARSYAEKQGASNSDYLEAVRLFKEAAAQGSIKAVNNIGVMYQQGIGVPQDLTEAQVWYKRAADKGYSIGQRNLALSYVENATSSDDNLRAAALLSEAAKSGDQESARKLGRIYENGIPGIEIDLAKADYWYGKVFE